MEPWKDVEHIVHKKAVKIEDVSSRPLRLSSPIYFFLKGSDYKARMKVNGGEGLNEIYIESEEYYSKGVEAVRNISGKVKVKNMTNSTNRILAFLSIKDISFSAYRN